jgi:hypothetical protein
MRTFSRAALICTLAVGSVPALAGEPVEPPPAPPSPKPESPYLSAYFSATAAIGLPGRGNWSSKMPSGGWDFATGGYYPQYRTGSYLSAYWVPVRRLQFGLYGRYLTGASEITETETGSTDTVFTSDWSAGVSIKVGGWPKDSVWLGGAADIGPVFFRANRDEPAVRTQSSLDSCLRLGLDWFLTPPGGMQMGLTASVGIEFTALVNGKVRSDSNIETSWSWIQPVVLVGVLFGGG